MESLFPLLPWLETSESFLTHPSLLFSRSNQLPNGVVSISMMWLESVPSFLLPPSLLSVSCHYFPLDRSILTFSSPWTHLHTAADIKAPQTQTIPSLSSQQPDGSRCCHIKYKPSFSFISLNAFSNTPCSSYVLKKCTHSWCRTWLFFPLNPLNK